MVEAQIGRPPRAPWRVHTRCGFGWPTTIVTPSRLEDGTPFPTLYWLTCPHLIEVTSAAESAGAIAEWESRLSSEAELREGLDQATAIYAHRRRRESGGEDVCAGTGIAGTSDPARLKCLHAHVAAFVAGVPDPVGEALVSAGSRECMDGRCSALAGRSYAGETP